jgi:hypothetical protein
MAEDYLTDDEQLEHVKQLFAEYGPWTFGAIVVGLGLAFGYRYYNQHMNERALDASAQFADMSAAVDGNNPVKARQIADGLIKSYPSSPYADQAQLVLARLAIDADQEAGAIGPLQEVIDHSKDVELKHIARLRRACKSIKASPTRRCRRFPARRAPSQRATTKCAATPITPRRMRPRRRSCTTRRSAKAILRAWTPLCSPSRSPTSV